MEIVKTWIVKKYNEYVKLHKTSSGDYFLEGMSYSGNVYRLIEIRKKHAIQYLNTMKD